MTQLVTGIAMKPLLLGNKKANIRTCKNGWLNFLDNFNIMALKLLQLTQFLSPNLSIYSYLLQFSFVLGGSLCSKVIFPSHTIYREVYNIYICLVIYYIYIYICYIFSSYNEENQKIEIFYSIIYIIYIYIYISVPCPPHYLVPSDTLANVCNKSEYTAPTTQQFIATVVYHCHSGVSSPRWCIIATVV